MSICRDQRRVTIFIELDNTKGNIDLVTIGTNEGAGRLESRHYTELDIRKCNVELATLQIERGTV